jgi:N-methylhydantoinase A
MAPVAGRAYAAADAGSDAVIVADAGGTTYDVTLVRRGEIPSTRSAWIGEPGTGHMTGLPSIDVKSVGAGGGSIAWVDAGGLLHVGPQSAGSVPGPACYGRGGTAATVTDAALVLGYLDPDHFGSGSMRLDLQAAHDAVQRDAAVPLGVSVTQAASAILELTTEQMVHAIEEITLQQGIDPSHAVLVGGGGAAGLNAAAVARRLGCQALVMPAVGAALAAAGALMSDLTAVHSVTIPALSDAFDAERVNAGLAQLIARGEDFAQRMGRTGAVTTLYAEARYPQQIWELEVPLRSTRFAGAADVAAFAADFHDVHEQILGIRDDASPVEVVSWGARVRVPLPGSAGILSAVVDEAPTAVSRVAFVPGAGMTDVPVRSLASIARGELVHGPLLIESPFTTIVVAEPALVELGPAGSLVIRPASTVSDDPEQELVTAR